MKTNVIAAAGLMVLTTGLAIVPPGSSDRSKAENVHTVGGDAAGSFTIAQKPQPRKQQPSKQQPANDGWGDIDPYSFGRWSDGANSG